MKSSDTFRALTFFAACALVIPAEAQDTDDLEQLRQHAVSLVNEARRQEGLAELKLGSILNEAAQGHATDMTERDYYAHVGPDGGTLQDRFRAAGGSRWALIGENIAKCSNCSIPPDIERLEAFHAGWMQSPNHRENILSEGFNSFGFGISGEGNEIYAVQTFAGPGSGDDAAALSRAEARAAALDAINVHRTEAGLDVLTVSKPLDLASERLLEMRIEGEDLPENIFQLIPEGSNGWTSLSILSASRGGSGGILAQEAVDAVVDSWADQGVDGAFGGETATHFGFAAAAQDDGRLTAVAMFGGQS
ncbi:MAG: CAP domain-containing protein [Pelagibaca sp.]